MCKRIWLILAYLVAGIFINSNASSITVSGNVSGSWAVDTVKVTGNILIQYGEELSVSPGCKILFEGYYKLTVWGKLLALGDSLHPIQFERADTTGFSAPTLEGGAWGGIQMGSVSSAASKLIYCSFRYLKGNRSINLEFGTSEFSFCTFQDNKSTPLVYLRNSGNRIRHSLFSDNSSSNILYIEALANDTVYFENNTVAYNHAVGIDYSGYINSALVLSSCIFWNNNTGNPDQVQVTYSAYSSNGFDTSTVIAKNCILQNGGQLHFYNSSCHDQDPRFVNPVQRDYSPGWDNYPIEDASKSIAIDNGYYLGDPDGDSSRSDIGAVAFFRIERRNNTWARFSLSSQTGYQSSLSVDFTNLSNIVTGQNTTWEWSFGDGSTSGVRSPTHLYTQSGIYSVKLKAIDQSGHTDSMVLNNIITIYPGTRVSAGPVQGIWKKQFSPYYVYGDIFVPDNNKLTIEPGVEVRIMGSYAIEVFGSLFSQGTVTDSITFRANDTTGMRLTRGMNIDWPFANFQLNKGWVGIHFISDLSERDTCRVEYTRIMDIRTGRTNSNQYKGALKLHRVHSAEVRHSVFRNNFTNPQYFITDVDTTATLYQNAGINSLGTCPVIENNLFENLYQFGPSAIYAIYSDSVRISANTFRNITNFAVSVEKVTSYRINNNVFDSVHGKDNLFDSTHGICLRLKDRDSVSSRIVNNEVSGNLFKDSRKAIMAEGVYRVGFTNNYFTGNVSNIDVGINTWGDKIYINNNLFYKNRVTATISNVGAVCVNMILVNSKKGVIANNTIIGNFGNGNMQSIIYGDESIEVSNNIIRNITGKELQGTRFTTGWEFTDFSKSYNNNVKGGYPSGLNNFNQPAMFADSLAGNFRLTNRSSSVNAGKPDTSGLLLPVKDFYGRLRIDTFLKRVDVGCAEFFTMAPSQIILSADSVKENMPVHTFISRLSTIDPDPSDTHSYSLISIPGIADNNAGFFISNDTLYSAVVFSFAQNIQKVSIRSKDDFGAYKDSSFNIQVKQNMVTGITDINQIRNLISVYPVPFNSFIVLDPRDGKTGAWQIFNASGQFLKSGFYRNRTLIDMSVLPAGVFFLNVFDKRTLYTIRIMKQE